MVDQGHCEKANIHCCVDLETARTGGFFSPIPPLFLHYQHRFILMDMEAEHAVPFSWATSVYIDCPTEELFDELFAKLTVNGMVMMGPEPVLQFRKVAWVTDQFGVTWQLVWE